FRPFLARDDAGFVQFLRSHLGDGPVDMGLSRTIGMDRNLETRKIARRGRALRLLTRIGVGLILLQASGCTNSAELALWRYQWLSFLRSILVQYLGTVI